MIQMQSISINLLALMSFACVMSITPGPNNLMLTAAGSKFGFYKTLPTMAGITLGNGLQTYLLCVGLGAIFIQFPIINQILKVTGVTYLLYLSWKLLGSSVGEKHADKPITFFQAILFQGVNPKAWMMGINIAALFMPTHISPWLGGLYVCGILMLINFPSIGVWALFGSAMRRFLSTPLRQKQFNWLMAILLALTAGHIALST